MAQIIKTNGTIIEVEPKNGRDFKLKELQSIVDGMISIHATTDGRTMIINDEGKVLGLPYNESATKIYKYGKQDFIVGSALICEHNEVK